MLRTNGSSLTAKAQQIEVDHGDHGTLLVYGNHQASVQLSVQLSNPAIETLVWIEITEKKSIVGEKYQPVDRP